MRLRPLRDALIAVLVLIAWPLRAGDFALPDVSELRLPPKAEVRRVDHLGQFADASTRKQGLDVESCHAFSSMAILEAAYRRQYKKPIRFSEAYVFLKRTVSSGGVYRKFCADGACEFAEFNDVLGDTRYALAHGAPSSLDYEAFLERYRKFRGEQLGAMTAFARTCPDRQARRRWVHDQKAASLELEKALLSDSRIAGEIAESLERIGRFEIREFPFDPAAVEYSHLLGPEDCRKRGADRLSALTQELDAGRPVAVGANLTELKAWRAEPGEAPFGHAFVIAGYTYSSHDGHTFHTRNSWGGTNPDFPEAQLCRIDSIVSVLNEEEARRQTPP